MSGENFFKAFGDDLSVTIKRTNTMKLVVIESPFAGDRERNARYLRACLLDSLRLGESPFASHAIYPLVLDDDKPEDRALGIAAGLAWGAKADLVAVYGDLGCSRGMAFGIEAATARGTPIEHRLVPGWAASEAGAS